MVPFSDRQNTSGHRNAAIEPTIPDAAIKAQSGVIEQIAISNSSKTKTTPTAKPLQRRGNEARRETQKKNSH